MSIKQILARKDLSCVVFCGNRYTFGPSESIKAQLEGHADGVELKIEVKGTDFHEVMGELWDRWCLATTGIPALAAPMIEHKAEEPPAFLHFPPTSTTDDEIPF